MPRRVIGFTALAVLVAVSSLTVVLRVSGPVREATAVRPEESRWSGFNAESRHITAMRGGMLRQRLLAPRPASSNERNALADA